MSVKINAKAELGIAKSFEVKESNKNMRKTWVLQKAMAKMAIDREQSGDDAADFESALDGMMEMQDTTIAYIVDILGLSEAQAEKIQDKSFEDTIAFAQRIAAEIMHIDMFEASEKETGLEA